ncbi:unnamed protein product [marine sediment metagenome]|uniref:Uncharacterized protein n=1 Tax=marine sediment metagenome TaxID=412755 RepID=X1C1Y3_9ZZZZ
MAKQKVKKDYSGLSTSSYFSKSDIVKLFELKEKGISDVGLFVFDMIQEGKLIKHFSYYKPTVKLLKEIGAIPKAVPIKDFDYLAKANEFGLKNIMEIFDCNKDVAKIITAKYFRYAHPFYKKISN